MKHIFLITLFAGLIVPTGLYAQKVHKDANDKVYLILTKAAGMPAGTTTNVSKYSGATAPATGFLYTTNSSSNQVNGSINADVFEKFEIAPFDINKAGQISGSGTFGMTWVEAFNGCKNARYPGPSDGGWRLPTQRELMLMYIFSSAIDEIFYRLGTAKAAQFNKTQSNAGNYFCATEHNATTAWYVAFWNGNAYYSAGDKNGSLRARCIREVTN